jgi:hypothetical protein
VIKPAERTAPAAGSLIENVRCEQSAALQQGLAQRDRDRLLEHDTSASSMMITECSQIADGIVFTLPNKQPVETILVWNYNRPSYTDQGVAKMDVSVWTETDGWKSIQKGVQLAEGEGTDDYDDPTVLTFKPVHAEKIRFDNITSIDPTSRQVGLSAVRFYGPRGPAACNPEPKDGRQVSWCELMSLAWMPGRGAIAHDVYMGDSAETLQLLGRVKGTSSVQVSGLSAGKFYAWRIDEVAENGTVEAGTAWSFTTKGSMVAHWPLDGTTEDIVGHCSGVIAGEPTWEDGVRGKALKLNGRGDAVEIEPLNLNTEAITMCAWIKPDQQIAQNPGIVFCRSDNTVAGINLLGDRLRYHWSDDSRTSGWDSGLQVPLERNWTFVALTVQPDQGVLFAGYKDSDLLSAINYLSHGPEEFDGTFYLGRDPSQDRYFTGLIDDVQVFDFALSTEQIQQIRDGQTLDLTGTDDIALVGAELVPEGQSLKDVAAEAKAQEPDESETKSNLPVVLVIVGIVLVIAVASAVRKKK